IELLRRRYEEVVHALGRGELAVARLVARVARQILARPELGRIHEEARDDGVVLLPRGAEEAEMALVERAHRRDEARREADRDRLHERAQLVDRACDLHAATCAVAATSASKTGRSSGAAAATAVRWRSTVAVSLRWSGPVSSKSLSIVRRIRGSSASAGAPASISSRAASWWSVTRKFDAI